MSRSKTHAVKASTPAPVRAAVASDAPKKPRTRVSAGSFDAGSTNRRTRGWSRSIEDINSLLFESGETLRDFSRDAVRKNPYATNALGSFVSNAIGTGIKLQSLHEDAKVRAVIHEAWTEWTDESDFNGLTDLYGQQRMICRTGKESGEVLVRFRLVPESKGLSVPLQLQVMEPDHLPFYGTGFAATPGNTIFAGIELDADDQRVAYHLYKHHPGAVVGQYANYRQIVRVPASEIIHHFDPLRPGQLRGQPWFTPVLLLLNELDQYTDAALLKKKLSAMYALFIKKTQPDGNALNEEDDDGQGHASAEIQSGTIQVLFPGEEIQAPMPPLDSDFEPFLRKQLEAAAAGLEMAYHLVTGDVSNANYSSIRAALLEFRRRCEQFQHSVFVFQVCRPIFKRWLREAVLCGRIKLPGYARNPRLYERVRWVTPGWPWVDPLKDMEAAQMAVRAGFTTRAKVVSETGEDVEQIDAENAADNARADLLKLRYDSDGRQVIGKGSEAKPPQPVETTSKKPNKQKVSG